MHKLVILFMLLFSSSCFSLEFFEGRISEQVEVYARSANSANHQLPEIDNSSSDDFILKSLVLKGNTILSKNDLMHIVRPYINKELNNASLYKLKKSIADEYQKLGFNAETVDITEQSIINGELILIANEKKIAKILITGNKSYSEEFFSNKLKTALSGPINVQNISRVLSEIQAEPGIKNINARLIPLNDTNYNGLVLAVQEQNAFHGSIEVNNHRSPYVGAETVLLSLGKRNLSGIADSLLFNVAASESSISYGLHYEIPLIKLNSVVSSYLSSTESKILNNQLPEQIQTLKSEFGGNSKSIGFSWFWQPKNKFKFVENMLFGFENTISETYVSELSEYQLSNKALYAGSSKTYRVTDFNNTLNYQFKYGFDLKQTGIYQDRSSSNFTSLTINNVSQLAVSPINSIIRISFKTQYALSKLSRTEMKSITGFNAVRGYQENSMINESIILLRSEIHKQLTGKTNLLGFVDYGIGSDNDNQKKNQALSLGAGISWKPINGLVSNTLVGLPLLNKPNASKNLQDYGIHFNVKYLF